MNDKVFKSIKQHENIDGDKLEYLRELTKQANFNMINNLTKEFNPATSTS